MEQTIKVTVNGREYERSVEPRLLLVHFLREKLGLTGRARSIGDIDLGNPQPA